jgi:hypothetical protein
VSRFTLRGSIFPLISLSLTLPLAFYNNGRKTLLFLLERCNYKAPNISNPFHSTPLFFLRRHRNFQGKQEDNDSGD